MLESAKKLELEGIVSKRLDAPYRSGRTESWTKAKIRGGQEVVLGGWKTTNGKFRSLMAGVYRGDHLVFVGLVGTGFGQDIVRRIMPALKAAASDKSPFGGKDAPKKTRDVHWLKPELVAEDRVRRLDRWRQHPAGRVQGAASGQAGEGGTRGEARHDWNCKAA